MNNIIKNKIIELGNYMLSINNNENKIGLIYSFIINSDDFEKKLFIKCLKLQDDNQEKEIITKKDENGNTFITKNFSTLDNWIDIYGLNDNEEVKNKLKEYLDYFISVKNN